MKIVVPYTSLRDETVAALAEYADGHDVHYVDVSDNDEQLFETWRWLWAAQEDTVVIEHDIVIGPVTIGAFEACPALWCAHAYEYSVFGLYAGTGCVRFRADLMAAFPDLWERVGQHENPTHPRRHWCSLDAFAQYELANVGYRMCRHEPAVLHLDQSNSHGCVPVRQLAPA